MEKNIIGKSWIIILILALVLPLIGCGKGSYEGHLKKGKDFFEQGKYPEARIELLNALKVKPDDREALLAMARTLMGMKALPEAVSHYRKVISLDPADRTAVLELAPIFLAGRAPDETLKVLEKPLAAHPGDWELLVLLSQALLLKKDIPGAEKALVEAEKSAGPGEDRIQMAHFNLLMAKGKSEEALAVLRDLVGRSPDRREYRLQLGTVLERMGRQDEALSLYQDMVREKDDAIIRNHLGLLLMARKDKEDAVAAWKRAVELDGSMLEPRLNLAALSLQGGEKEKGLTQLEEILKMHPGYPEALALRGEISLRDGKAKEAAADLAKALEGSPDNNRVRFLLSQALSAAGDLRQAREHIWKVVESDPKNSQARLLLARLDAGLGNLDQASSFAAALSRDKVFGREALWLMGDTALRSGKPAEAEKIYRTSLAAFPSHPGSRLRLATALDMQKKWKEAEGLYLALLKEQPDAFPVLSQYVGLLMKRGDKQKALEVAKAHAQKEAAPQKMLLGSVLESTGKTGEAEKIFLSLLEENSDFLPAYPRYVQSLMAQGKAAEARNWLSGMLKDPKKAKPQLWVLQGMLQDIDKDRKNAMASYREALQMKPDFVPALNNLAWDLQEEGDLKEALKYASMAKDRAPKDPFILDTYGWIFFKLGDMGEARARLEEAAAIMPEHPQIREHLEKAKMKAVNR